MPNYKIISDSSCDLPEQLRNELEIDLVPFYVSLDQKKYYKEITELGIDEFYSEVVANNLFPKTSLPTIQDYMDIFENYLKQGLDIICFCLTSKFSGSYQSAVNAKGILLENYPSRKIEVIDSIQATGGQGLIVYEAGKMRQEGYSFQEVIEKSNKLKETARINFTLDSLDHLQKGGRIGKVSALAGTILNIKPIIVVKDGKLIPDSKVRGHKKALQEIISKTVKEIGQEKEKYDVCLLNSCREEAVAYVEKVLSENHGISIIKPIFRVGVTIGTHAGPTALGICYIRKFDSI